VAGDGQITTAEQAANDGLVLAFGWLQGAANRLEYVLGRAIEQECGISHLMFEVLLILGRAGGPGMSMRAVAPTPLHADRFVTRAACGSLTDASTQATPCEFSRCGRQPFRAAGPLKLVGSTDTIEGELCYARSTSAPPVAFHAGQCRVGDPVCGGCRLR